MKLLRRINERKGFTFVEMMMVIAILAVILAFAVPGFASYSKRIKLMELDDSARTIFMAAQNRLMSLHTSGADIDFAGSESVKIDEVPDCFTKVKDEHGNEKEYYDYTAEGYYQPDFRYITSKKIKDIADSDHSIIVGLSSGGPTSIEDRLYQNYFIIEYDASTGFVLGVFYTEEEDLLFKEEGDGETLGAAYPSTLSAKREFEDRLDAGGTVGYYGGGTLVNIPRGNPVDTPEYSWFDREKLVVYVKWPEGQTADKLYFSFKITGNEKNGTPHTIEIVPESEHCFIKNGDFATIILDSLAPGLGADNGKWDIPSDKNMSGYVLERDFKGWVLKDNLEYVADTNLYCPKFDGSTAWKEDNYPTDSNNNDTPGPGAIYGSGTNSPYLINPGVNISVQIAFYDSTGANLEISTEPFELNSYFSDLVDGTAYITAGRHLQNLANYVVGNTVTKAVLVTDIDFSDSKDSYNSWNADVTYRDYYDFKPIGSQFVKDSTFLSEFDGRGNTISYLKITSDAHSFPEGSAGNTNTAFITDVLNSGRVHDLIFYRPKVIGKTENTAVFVGYAGSGTNLKNISIINPIVEGPKYVGTLCGNYDASSGVENCYTYVEAYKDNYDFTGNDMDSIHYKESLDWSDPTKDPYEKFYVRGTTSEAYAGGLIGRSVATLNDPYCAVRVESEGVAGGLIGISEGGNIQKAYVGGHTYDGTYIGTFKDASGAEKKYCLINVNGKVASGGLIGQRADGGIDGGYSTASVNWLESNQGDSYIGIPNGQTGINEAYALGYIIDPASKTVKSRRSQISGVSGLSDIQSAKEIEAEPYDDFLKGLSYPYRTSASNNSTHIGDWPVDPPVMGVFYWENVGGEYGILGKFYDAKKGESGKIDTLTDKEDAEVDSYGYGYFYTPAVTTASEKMLEGIINGSNLTVDTSVRDEIEKDTQVMPIIVMRNASSAAVHDLVSLSFDYSYKDASGEKTFRFNPDFCGVSELETLGTDGNRYRIRSAAQFSNIKNSRGAAFEQDLSINLGNHYAIGSLKKGAFTGMYNGKGKTIEVHNLFFEAESDIADGNGIGIFGVTRGAKIEKIEANYSSSNIPDINGESSSRIGVGGIAGIAIGGSIENCKVYNFHVSVTNRYNTAIGGIVGYSSADISNCEINGDGAGNSITIKNVTGGSAGDVAAAGGIAGSASGTITKCKVNICSMGDMKAAKIEAESNAPLVIAGGIVGNNVSFEGKTELTVDSCISHAQLTRPYRTEAKSYGLNNITNYYYDYNVLIHPIAPDNFVLDTSKKDYYTISDDEFFKWLLKDLSIIKIDDEELPVYQFASGTGVESIPTDGTQPIVDVKYEGTNTASQGHEYYNSRLCGESVGHGIVMEKRSEPTRDTSDVYVFSPQNPIYTTYTKLAPTAGIYSLYEKDGSSIFAKPYYKETKRIDNTVDKPEGNADPLYRYGVLVTLGRFDEEEVVVTIDGKPTKAIGQSYTDQSGSAITLSTSDSGNAAAKYFDFSEEIISEPGEHTVTVEFKGEDGRTETVLNTTIDIPKKRPPYVGVYQLKKMNVEDPNEAKKLDGVYTDETRFGDHPNEIESGGTEIGEYGIMLEHSDVAPHTLGEIKVTLSYKVDEKVVEKVLKPSELVNAGKDAYSGENWVKPQVHGKYFDFYDISKSVLEEIPEYTEITITVRYKDGEKLASAAYRTPLQIPHFGVYGVESVPFIGENNGNPYNVIKYITKFAKDGDDKRLVKNEIAHNPSNIDKEHVVLDSYGILLEKGYDINKVTVKLSGGKKDVTIDGKDLVRCNEQYKDSADQWLNKFQNNGHLSDGVTYDLYTIPYDQVPEGTTTIKIVYTGAGGSYEMSVDITEDLKVDVKGHEHKFGDWEHDADKHWRYCTVDDCYEKDENGNNKKLDEDSHVAAENWVDDNEAGKSYLYCSVCGYKMKERELLKHDHVPSEELSSDQDGHWYACTAKKQYYDDDGVLQEEDCTEKIQWSAHKKVCTPYPSDDNYHSVICSVCHREAWSEPHTWQDDPDDNTQLICKDCKMTRKKDMPDEDEINNVGIYAKYAGMYNSYYRAWFSDNKEYIPDNVDLTYPPNGEVGVVFNKEFENQITVYVDGEEVKLLPDNGLDYHIIYHYGYDKEHTAFKIDPEAIKDKEVITITIAKKGENSSGGGLLFEKTVKIREHKFELHDKPNSSDVELVCPYCGDTVTLPKFAVLFYKSDALSQYYMIDQFGNSTGAKDGQTVMVFLIAKGGSGDLSKFTLKKDDGTNAKLMDLTADMAIELPPDLSDKYEAVATLDGNIYSYIVNVYYDDIKIIRYCSW